MTLKKHDIEVSEPIFRIGSQLRKQPPPTNVSITIPGNIPNETYKPHRLHGNEMGMFEAHTNVRTQNAENKSRLKVEKLRAMP